MGGTSVEKNKVGSIGTFSNILNSFFGSGVLGLPYAFRMSGWLAGIISLLFIAVISRYCMELLLKCRELVLDRDIKEEEESLRSEASYGDIGRFAFGEPGFCCVYMIFLGENLNSVFPNVSMVHFIYYCATILILVSWLRSMKWLSPFSLFAEVCTILGLIIVNIYAVAFYLPETPVEIYPIMPKTFPIFFGIAAASYEGIGLVIPIQQSMKEPEKYSRLLNISMTLVTLVFITSSVTSYYCFGQETESIITLNLPSNSLSSIVKLTVCSAIFFTYPIQLFPVVQILESYLITRSSGGEITSEIIKRNCLRTFLVLFTAFAAIRIPHFGEVIGLIGSIGAGMLAFILPALFYLKLFHSQLDRKQKIMHQGIVVFGVVGGLAASYVDVLYAED